MQRARCPECSTGQVLIEKPGKSLCPYICDNGFQTLRLSAEMMEPESSLDTYFGDNKGNSLSKDTSYERILQTGGQVSNPAVAVSKINNNDGVGAGKDVYTQYCGNGAKFPPASEWVSFENMYGILP